MISPSKLYNNTYDNTDSSDSLRFRGDRNGTATIPTWVFRYHGLLFVLVLEKQITKAGTVGSHLFYYVSLWEEAVELQLKGLDVWAKSHAGSLVNYCG